MITPKNKELSKLVLWEDRGNTVLYKIENNALLFSHNLDQGGITFDIEDMQEVDFDLVGSEIDYRPILKKLGLNDEEVNQFMKKKKERCEMCEGKGYEQLQSCYDEIHSRIECSYCMGDGIEIKDLDRYIHREEKQDEHNT